MALRRFHTATSNQETYGKLIVDGMDEQDGTVNIALDYQPQFPLVGFARSYQKNPFWFSKTGLNIYRLVDSGTPETYDIYQLNSDAAPVVLPNAFSDAIVFADWREVTDVRGTLTADYTNSYCKTLSKNSWHFLSSTDDAIEQVVLDLPVTIDRHARNGDGHDLYILISERESILGDIFAIIRDSKTAYGSSGTTWDTAIQGVVLTDLGSSTSFSLGNISDDFASAPATTLVEPVIFTDTAATQATSGYNFYIEDNGDMILSFDTATAATCVVLVRADLPLATVKYPGGLHSDGFDVSYENFPYSRMELNTRTK
jgi:hypothetical protein